MYYLKIDGQFTTSLLDDPLDNAAVRCFCEVAQVVGVKTIAEFVERADIRGALATLGVVLGQPEFAATDGHGKLFVNVGVFASLVRYFAIQTTRCIWPRRCI